MCGEQWAVCGRLCGVMWVLCGVRVLCGGCVGLRGGVWYSWRCVGGCMGLCVGAWYSGRCAGAVRGLCGVWVLCERLRGAVRVLCRVWAVWVWVCGVCVAVCGTVGCVGVVWGGSVRRGWRDASEIDFCVLFMTTQRHKRNFKQADVFATCLIVIYEKTGPWRLRHSRRRGHTHVCKPRKRDLSAACRDNATHKSAILSKHPSSQRLPS